MRTLFDLDAHDYPADGHVFRRDSARCITIRDGKVAMVHSGKYDYYKFPDGGIEPGETPVDAMIREAREEAGLVVIPASVREYGRVPRRHRGMYDKTEIFAQDNFYFLCDTGERLAERQLDPYEADERFTLVWVDPRDAIRVNRRQRHDPKSPTMLEREARVLELLMQEGYFL